MTFEGVLGNLQLSGDFIPVLLQILYVGQWMHVGNKTTFGMGKYHCDFK
ncbi:CRISPR system precrRNA processing endoribonuclease RAMP protein Cas6 [Methylotuvimicrobium alcaliphilum]